MRVSSCTRGTSRSCAPSKYRPRPLYDTVADSDSDAEVPLSVASSPTSQTGRAARSGTRSRRRAGGRFRGGDVRFGVTIFSSFFAFAAFVRTFAARATAFLYWRRASSAAFRAARASLLAFLAAFFATLTRRFASRDFAFSCFAVARASLSVRCAARAASIASADRSVFRSGIDRRAYLIEVEMDRAGPRAVLVNYTVGGTSQLSPTRILRSVSVALTVGFTPR